MQGGIMNDRDGAMPSHGVFGRVIGSSTDTLLIKQNDGVETSVAITGNTVIESLRQRVPQSEVHVFDTVVVIGEPNATGQIVATFVRVLPAPQNFTIPAR
jgi:hypothetical protein